MTGAQSAALYFAVSLTFTLPGQQWATAGLQEAVAVVVSLHFCAAQGLLLGATCRQGGRPSMDPRKAGPRPHLSASSRMMILWRPGGSVTFFCANILILLRTTSMPLHTRRGRPDSALCAHSMSEPL